MSFENEINWNIINAVNSTLDSFFLPRTFHCKQQVTVFRKRRELFLSISWLTSVVWALDLSF